MCYESYTSYLFNVTYKWSLRRNYFRNEYTAVLMGSNILLLMYFLYSERKVLKTLYQYVKRRRTLQSGLTRRVFVLTSMAYRAFRKLLKGYHLLLRLLTGTLNNVVPVVTIHQLVLIVAIYFFYIFPSANRIKKLT